MAATPLLVLPPALDYAGVTVFALTGALAAARDRHDLVTFWFFALVTGVGGGTLRDLLIGAPVFWIADAAYLWIGAAASLAVWIAGERIERAAALIWLDALGLGAYAVIGAAKALALHVDPVVATAMGVLTACFGGVIRDVLAGQPSVLLKREISVSAALLAAALFVLLTVLHTPPAWAGMTGAVAGFALRAGAIHYGWRLRAFGERRGERKA
ncbi:MAG: trimeric intracellular cation channel family protein [Proteobacteria bacterium]|nr:trimeric intracellular cation channel family protein [Pseudomonadota bacterium]